VGRWYKYTLGQENPIGNLELRWATTSAFDDANSRIILNFFILLVIQNSA